MKSPLQGFYMAIDYYQLLRDSFITLTSSLDKPVELAISIRICLYAF
ncbi:MAG: hypothetical protein PUA69_06210 [Erysipelotrichaceae bacterium]|nr:hypothetical protein [Erysipelotrichaceae bacterium]